MVHMRSWEGLVSQRGFKQYLMEQKLKQVEDLVELRENLLQIKEEYIKLTQDKFPPDILGRICR
jgi:hypothetical protein